ncbi:hypothetical protein P152DRAFT_133744 [Eremomyces bilateralis CBS 781.70]|uniref:Uncharacterized protein n=1 Tax=Eremomyces bilateralis CBS 781.70 TaxID=1392243 RepID=A0A6G1GFN5_9PEZI|nr:uncharacterized protein P152DRAFT_133744 [Eremomyces bilateralis CBS 781.70]KAF1816689.1 hypothetical protein P152DRAFT_133744 [Eremomyces bilateralis CBS 781.70]
MEGDSRDLGDSPLLPNGASEDTQTPQAWSKPHEASTESPPPIPPKSALRPRSEAFSYHSASAIPPAGDSNAITIHSEDAIARSAAIRSRPNRFGEVFYEDSQIASPPGDRCSNCLTTQGARTDAHTARRRSEIFTVTCLIAAGVLLGWVITSLSLRFFPGNLVGDGHIEEDGTAFLL